MPVTDAWGHSLDAFLTKWREISHQPPFHRPTSRTCLLHYLSAFLIQRFLLFSSYLKYLYTYMDFSLYGLYEYFMSAFESLLLCKFCSYLKCPIFSNVPSVKNPEKYPSLTHNKCGPRRQFIYGIYSSISSYTVMQSSCCSIRHFWSLTPRFSNTLSCSNAVAIC